MHPFVLTTLSRISSAALLLQSGFPLLNTAKDELNAASARHASPVRAVAPPAPMPGVPLMQPARVVGPSEYVTHTPRPSGGMVAVPSLIDEQGRLRREISPAEERAWRIEISEGAAGARKARLLIQSGEVQIAHHEPARARALFDAACALLPQKSPDYGLARFDAAIAIFRSGRFEEAKTAFRDLVKSPFVGFNRRTATLYGSHTAACEGYHRQHNELGIPEPDRLDPLCGIAALAVCLRGRQMPFPKAELKKKIYFNGEGSSMADLETALPSLGLSGHMVTADEEGLKRLPKPLVAFVEHDHFVAVVKADKKGVEYFCSDCGPWPGGPVQLTWKQWRAMESSQFLAVAKRDTAEALALDNLPTSKEQGAGHVLQASVKAENRQIVSAAEALLSRLGTAVLGQGSTLPKNAPPICGVAAWCLHCLGFQNIPWFGAGIVSAFGTGDPVNAATGEEEYSAPESLSVYNPTGPSVRFAPSYYSLANTTPNGFGSGWTHPYNMRIIMESTTSSTGTLVLPNSGRIAFSFPAYLPNQNLTQPCGGANFHGLNLSLKATYGTGPFGVDHFTLTFPDRTAWTFRAYVGAGVRAAYYPTRITDKAGNFISLVWSPMTYTELDIDRSGGGTYTNNSYGLTSINDSIGNALLTLNYTSGGRFADATDRYSRKVAYAIGSFATTNVPSGLPQNCDELTAISQIVPSSTTTPPVRASYGYQNYNNTEVAGGGAETIPFLHTISVPSPTGTGMSTATINYSSIGEVTDLVDANGNRTVVSPAYVGGVAQPNSARIQILGPSPSTTVVKQYDLYFDAQMNPTKYVDAAGNTVWTKAYSSPNDPYGATSITDGNGRTWTKTYDLVGRSLTSTSPKGITTTVTYIGSAGSFDAEPYSAYTGSLATTFYSISSGFVNQVSVPNPNASGTADFFYTYTAKGNVKTITKPGNNVDSSGNAINQTTTYEYVSDGSYSQAECLGQPIKITDPLGHVTHIRYNPRGTVYYVEDSLGYRTYYDYTLSDQPAGVYNPPTGNTGTGSSSTTNTYLYEGGPVTHADASNESGAVVRTVSFTYGPEGETLTRTGSAEAVAQTYNAAYQVKTVTDGNSHTTNYSYNTVGRLTSMAYPGASGANYDQVKFTSYDPAGNLLSQTDGNGQITNFGYTDTDGLLETITYPGATSNNVTIAYDSYDRQTSMGNGTEVVTKAYNNASYLTSTTQQFVGSSIPTQTTNYTYWFNGHRKTMSNIAGTWSYSYDDEGRYSSMTSPAATAYAYFQPNDWQSGRAVAIGTGVNTGFAQNAVGQTYYLLNSSNGGTVSRFDAATFDEAFNLTGLTATVPSVPSQSGNLGYSYDTKNRLTAEYSPGTGGVAQTFAYDSAGNATTLRSTGGLTYDSDNRRLSSAIAYDGNGNPTTLGPSMTFDPQNRLKSFGPYLSYGYRPDNLRAWKQVDTTRTYFLYDGSQPVAELNASGAVVAINVFAPDGLVARKQGSAWIYYQFDIQGNVTQRLDGSGNILSSSAYDAYGKETTTASLNDPFSFNGKYGYYHDTESELYYCQNRYYNLYLGRWLNRDPAGFAGGINIYSYCHDGPVSWFDAEGLNEADDLNEALRQNDSWDDKGVSGPGTFYYYEENGQVKTRWPDQDEPAPALRPPTKIRLGTPRRTSVRTLRNQWSRAYNCEWPKASDGSNLDADHPTPLADGGEDNWQNIRPLSKASHSEVHSLGQRQGWARRVLDARKEQELNFIRGLQEYEGDK